MSSFRNRRGIARHASSTIRAVVLGLLAASGGASAATRLHNNGFTASNQALPGHPGYGSAVAGDGANWTATFGRQGVLGTPDIGLVWDGEGGGDSGFGVETFANFGSRGGAIQLDGGKTGGTRLTKISFVPGPEAGVRIDSFDLDIAHDQAHEVRWSVHDLENRVLGQGTWNRATNGRDTIAVDVQGTAGQTLVLELNHVTGNVTYLGLDNLAFDQVRQESGPGIAVQQAHHARTEPVAVAFWSGPGNAGDRVVLCPEGNVPGTVLGALYVGGTGTASTGVTSGTVVFTNHGIAPGRYDAWLLEAGTGAALAGPAAFEVDAPGLAMTKAEFAYGEAVTASFQGGPGKVEDRIALYPAGVTPATDHWYLDYLYTSGSRTAAEGKYRGSVTFGRSFAPPGEYQAWFLGQGFQVLAGPVAFRVTSEGTLPPPRWLSPFVRVRHAVAGSSYECRISAHASDPGDVQTFSKISGPSWLAVTADGRILGTPAAADTGTNRFTLRSTDLKGGHADTELRVEVFPAGAEHVGRFKVMTHNTLLRWEEIDDGNRKGVEAIVQADADVVGFQESGSDQALRAAEALGWYYVPPGNGWARMISRYPVAQSLPGGGGAQGARIRLSGSPLREVIVYNCYHSANFSALSAAAKPGATADSVLAEEMRSSRPADTQAMLGILAPYLANAEVVPVFLTGDFNTSSHLDWSAATAARHNGVGHVAWPGSLAITQAGMLDSYRVIHPDPVASPGVTWTPLLRDYPVPDRIDFIYYKGGSVHAIDSTVFHTAIETTVGSGESIAAVARGNTWPTDHASVVSTFRLDPIDGDGDGFSDAWERRWSGGLDRFPGTGSACCALDDRWHMLLGLDPGSGAGCGLAIEDDGLSFQISELAGGQGVRLERSLTLAADDWETLWDFDHDPLLRTGLLSVSTPSEGLWRLKLDLDPQSAPASFFRLTRNDPAK